MRQSAGRALAATGLCLCLAGCDANDKPLYGKKRVFLRTVERTCKLQSTPIGQGSTPPRKRCPAWSATVVQAVCFGTPS